MLETPPLLSQIQRAWIFSLCPPLLFKFGNELHSVSPSFTNDISPSSSRQTIPARCPGWWWPSRLWTWTTTHRSWTDSIRRPCATPPPLARSGQALSFSAPKASQMISNIVFQLLHLKQTFVCVDGSNDPGENWCRPLSFVVFLQHNQRRRRGHLTYCRCLSFCFCSLASVSAAGRNYLLELSLGFVLMWRH